MLDTIRSFLYLFILGDLGEGDLELEELEENLLLLSGSLEDFRLCLDEEGLLDEDLLLCR